MTESEKINSLRQSFEEVIASEDYQYVKEHFDNQSLSAYEGDFALLAQKYLKESGIKLVFRTFESFARAGSGIESVESSVLLEDE